MSYTSITHALIRPVLLPPSLATPDTGGLQHSPLQMEKEHSNDQASLVNVAYRTLRSPLGRANYLIKLLGGTPVDASEGTIDDPEVLMARGPRGYAPAAALCVHGGPVEVPCATCVQWLALRLTQSRFVRQRLDVPLCGDLL